MDICFFQSSMPTNDRDDAAEGKKNSPAGCPRTREPRRRGEESGRRCCLSVEFPFFFSPAAELFSFSPSFSFTHPAAPPLLSFSPSHERTQTLQGRYELVCERAHGLVPFNPSRSTRVTLATPGCSPAAEAAAQAAAATTERGNGEPPSSSFSQQQPRPPPRRSPRDEFLLFNVGDALHIAPLFQIDRAPLRCLVFDVRESSNDFVPPSSSSFLRGTTPVCHAWRPLPPSLRRKEPDVIVGLAGGACVLLSLELELQEAASRTRGNGGDGGGDGEREEEETNFHVSSSPSCSSPVAAQVLWPPPPLVLGGAARSHEDGNDFVAVSVSPSLPSRVVAVAWAPGSRAVVVNACGLVAVHEPPWGLQRADEEDEEEQEMEGAMGEEERRRTASGNDGALFEAAMAAAAAAPSPPTSRDDGGGEEEGEEEDVDASSPASSSFMTAAGTTTASSSPPGGVGNNLLTSSSISPAGGGIGGGAGLSAAAAAHATTPPTPPTPPSRRLTQNFEGSEREQRQRFARPAVRTFSVVADLDEKEKRVGAANGSRRRRTAKPKKKKKTVPRSSIVASAALSPDGTLLATAGRDGVARVHSLATGRMVAGFSAYYGALHAVAW